MKDKLFSQSACDRYNTCYDNPSYLSIRQEIGALSLDSAELNTMMSLVIDACLEICGWHFFDGSEALLLECCRAVSGPRLQHLVSGYLDRFREIEFPF